MNCTAGVVLITKGTALPVDAEDGEKVMSVVRPTLFKIGTNTTQLERNCPICTHTHSVIYNTCGCFWTGVLDPRKHNDSRSRMASTPHCMMWCCTSKLPLYYHLCLSFPVWISSCCATPRTLKSCVCELHIGVA